MARPRQHRADDGSFGRSAGIQAGRGALLLAVALILGIVLLNAADDPPPAAQVSAGDSSDDTTSTTAGAVVPEDTVPTIPLKLPAEVKLLVANGTTTKGVARKVTDQLQPVGYNVLSPTDASKSDASAVYYAAGYDREATAVAALLVLPPTSVQPLPTPGPVADVREANVVVVVGTDLAERVNATPAATTTPAAGSSTSVP